MKTFSSWQDPRALLPTVSITINARGCSSGWTPDRNSEQRTHEDKNSKSHNRKSSQNRHENPERATMLVRNRTRYFLGSPGVKIPCSQCRRHGLNPWWGPTIPHAAQCGKKTKKQAKLKTLMFFWNSDKLKLTNCGILSVLQNHTVFL